MAMGEGREDMVGIFLRNIPAKCDQGILCGFLHTKGLTDFEVEMALFPDGKSRGFAVIHCCQMSVQTFVSKVHGQFLPGFQKTTPLRCEALRGTGPRRYRQSHASCSESRHCPCHPDLVDIRRTLLSKQIPWTWRQVILDRLHQAAGQI